MSNDGGVNWDEMNTGFIEPKTDIQALAISSGQPKKLYAGTFGQGVQTLQLPVSDIANEVYLPLINK